MPGEVPEQTVDTPVTDPPVTVEVTLITNTLEVAEPQVPLCTFALNCVVWLSTPGVYEVVVFEIGVHVVNGETELSQLVTFPICPVKFNAPGFEPEQIPVGPFIEPPTTKDVTLIESMLEVAVPQVPFWTTAL